jgi:hypothetical protein
MQITRRPERVLIVVAAAIVLALLGGYLFAVRNIPSVLRYVPLESKGFVVTAPLKQLWGGLAPHLTHYFADEATDAKSWRTKARRVGLDLRKQLDSKQIVLQRAEDMASIGVDGNRQAAVAAVERRGRMHVLAVIPVLDRARFIGTLEILSDETPRELADRAGSLLGFGGVVLTFGDDGTALLSDNTDVLRLARHASDQRLVDFRSSDRLTSAFAASLPATGGAQTAWLRGWVRLVDPLPLGGELFFSLAADDTGLAVEGRTSLTPGRSRLVSSLFQREPLPHFDVTLPRSDLALSLNGTLLNFLLRDLVAVPAVAKLKPLQGHFAPVFAQLQRSDSVRGLSVAVSNANQRVPGMVLGLLMAESDADAFVLRIQASLRSERDREVLRSARATYAQRFGTESVPTNRALLDAGILEAEPGALWSRYATSDAEPDPALTAEDFSGDEYMHAIAGGGTLRSLMPPFSDNDLVHRFANMRDDLQVDELREDRFRLSSIYKDGSLWIGNDGQVLTHWTDRLQREAQTRNFSDAAILDPDAANAKVLAAVQPVPLLEAGKLYPDADVNRTSRQWLTDLAAYRTALFSFSSDPKEQELYVRATLLRQ